MKNVKKLHKVVFDFLNIFFICLHYPDETRKILISGSLNSRFCLRFISRFMEYVVMESTNLFQEKEKELDLQRSMNQELDMALRLLEKDIHEKQDTVIQLRKQLDDIKGINLEMYNKLQVCLKSIYY